MKPNRYAIKMNPLDDRMWLVHQRFGKPAVMLKCVEDEFALCLAAELDRYPEQHTITRTMRFDDGTAMEIEIRYLETADG